MRLPYVDRMLWVPAELADSARIRADLTITPDAYKDEAEPVLLYEEKPGMIGVPRAWGLRKLAWLTGGTVPEDRTVKPVRLWPSLRFPEGWSYRKGQQSAIETLYQSFHVSKLYGSILEADCGSGKTLMGTAVASRLHTPTLVVVHKDDLAEQWKNTLKTFFPGAICGHVQGKKWDYENKHVVVATAQTLYRHRADLPYDFSHGFGCVIYDEAHRYPARTFERVLKLFPCRHRLAVSATLRRADKMECVWYWHVGHVEARCSGLKVTGDYIQIPWTTGLTDEMMRLYGDVSIVKWCNAIAENGPFNNWLVSQCLEGHKAGRKVLVVSDRVEQLCLLRTKIMESGVASATVGMYVGSMPVPGRTTRKKVSIAELKTASECDIILATYGKMAEGTDISDLDTLFFATPRTDIEQVVGRLQRPHDGKKQLLIVDPVFQTPYNRRLANKRREIYKSLEFNERRSGSE